MLLSILLFHVDQVTIIIFSLDNSNDRHLLNVHCFQDFAKLFEAWVCWFVFVNALSIWPITVLGMW